MHEWSMLFRCRVRTHVSYGTTRAEVARYCGNTTDYCGDGCQPGFGDCSSSVGGGGGTCGPAFGNAQCPTGQCCSAAVRRFILNALRKKGSLHHVRATVEPHQVTARTLIANSNSVLATPTPLPLARPP